jgi:hypothetical protein
MVLSIQKIFAEAVSLIICACLIRNYINLLFIIIIYYCLVVIFSGDKMTHVEPDVETETIVI